MSRKAVILLVVLCAAVAGVLVLSNKRTSPGLETLPGSPNTDVAGAGTSETPSGVRPAAHPAPLTARPAETLASVPPTTAGVGRTAIAAPHSPTMVQTSRLTQLPFNNRVDINEMPDIKPLPVLEKDYVTATNRDTRLDIMMDIAESPGAESVRALTRLFELETDPDLKVDLLDSLLGIEGFKEEKLIMLTMGARQGLPGEVRQSAIDGLIDLDDPRVIPVLNGLLNDPDPDIREGAQDALEMIQSEPPPAAKVIGVGK